MERKTIRISLGGFVGILIIGILLFAVIGMGMYIVGKDSNENKPVEPNEDIGTLISEEDAIKLVKEKMETAKEEDEESKVHYANIRVDSVEIQTDTIKANVVMELEYFRGQNVWERVDDVKTNITLVKQEQEWKIEQYVSAEEYYNNYITKVANNTMKIENSPITEWHKGLAYLSPWIFKDLANFEQNIKINSEENDIYLEINDEKLLYTQNMKGRHLVKEVKANELKESLIGVVLREQELYAVALLLTNAGELYYGSGYIAEDNSMKFEKLNIDSNIKDIAQAWYGNRKQVLSNYEENILEDAGLDIIMQTEEGTYYSFENYIRGII